MYSCVLGAKLLARFCHLCYYNIVITCASRLPWYTCIKERNPWRQESTWVLWQSEVHVTHDLRKLTGKHMRAAGYTWHFHISVSHTVHQIIIVCMPRSECTDVATPLMTFAQTTIGRVSLESHSTHLHVHTLTQSCSLHTYTYVAHFFPVSQKEDWWKVLQGDTTSMSSLQSTPSLCAQGFLIEDLSGTNDMSTSAAAYTTWAGHILTTI